MLQNHSPSARLARCDFSPPRSPLLRRRSVWGGGRRVRCSHAGSPRSLGLAGTRLRSVLSSFRLLLPWVGPGPQGCSACPVRDGRMTEKTTNCGPSHLLGPERRDRGGWPLTKRERREGGPILRGAGKALRAGSGFPKLLAHQEAVPLLASPHSRLCLGQDFEEGGLSSATPPTLRGWL